MSFDDDAAPGGMIPVAPDAHGHAALLLVESLIHTLVARAVIDIEDAIDIVDTADSVQIDVAEAGAGMDGEFKADGAGASPMWQAHALLSAIARSLRHDHDGQPAPPLAAS